nr:hypothetical protein [Pseudomonas sp.]
MPAELALAPRFIRASAAPAYLGMCRDEFNKTVRPCVREFPIGKQGVGFDREELDAWADSYVELKAIEKDGARGNNRPRSERQGESKWRKEKRPGYSCAAESGTSTRLSEVKDFEKALELVKGRKPSST